MPIKFPKGFQRRKSSGNVLDDAPATESSFKVFARPASSGQTLDVGAARRDLKPFSAQRNSYEQEDEDLFTVMRPHADARYYSQPSLTSPGPDRSSGSGGTDKSLSVAQYDSAASSSRLSTTSTNPSSIDTKSDKNVQPNTTRAQSEGPAQSPQQSRAGGFLRNAGRTFSFGVRSQKDVRRESEDSSPSGPPPPVPAGRHRFSVSTAGGRERAMTASSVSTATPPRLLESDVAIPNAGLDGFGNMFDSIGKSREQSPVGPVARSQPSPAFAAHTLHPDMHRGPPRPINTKNSSYIESSPFSGTSDTSRDGLMRSPSPPRTATQNSPQTVIHGSLSTSPMFMPPSDSRSEDDLFSETPSRPRAYSRPNRQAGPPPAAFHNGSRLPDVRSPQTVRSISERPNEHEDTGFDASLLDSAALATKFQEKREGPSKKIMTPQQFERYRAQQDERFRLNKVFGKENSDESDDDYDDGDEDEMERDRQAVKQRKKQEAHLAVYRQTMIKVTGEPAPPAGPPTLTLNHSPTASTSNADFMKRSSTFNLDPHAKSTPGRSSSEDEDDDVPLGILAAHGFPSKNRPPTRLVNQGSNSNLRAGAPPHAAAASVAAESINRMSLPAFARKLPEDPYYGAGLVNSSQRDSLAFHSQSTPNLANLAVPSPSGAATNHPLHPAGLVGVIAGEERARAARRGSPNPISGQFDLPQSMPPSQPGMLRSQTMGQVPMSMMHGMPMPGMMPMMPPLTPGDHAQIQMSQQMAQMMQMQMQWMQQMQSLMAGQNASPGPSHMSMMGPPTATSEAGLLGRPQSVPLQNYAGPPQRTMSSLDPSMANWNLQLPTFHDRPNSTYAPSIAPSERSNLGLASRYRPVSIAPEPAAHWQKRASTMTSTTFRPLSTLSNMATPNAQSAATVRKVAAADDDDDEAGWAEMKANKEKKQRSWKLRKGNNPLQELYNGTG